MKNLVYIAGLSHSGSTLLDLILGCYPEFVGLGEVARVIDRKVINERQFSSVYCSCGEKMLQCPVWSAVVNNLSRLPEGDFDKKYQMILDTAEKQLNNNAIVVDSSKYVNYLKPLVKNRDNNLKVIFIVKDVRNYLISQIDNLSYEKANKKSFLKSNVYYFCYQWYLMNKQIQKYMRDQKLDVLQIGYEELCLSTEKVLNLIGEFVGVDMAMTNFDLNSSKSHSVLGNRMRTQKDKAKLLYDYRWFQRKEWQLPSLLNPHIMKYNRANVYSHNFLEMWSR